MFYSLVILCFFLAGCESNVTNNESHIDLGKKYFDQGQFKKSKIEIKNAIQENPKNSEAYYYLGLLNEKQRQFRAMRENLIKSVEFDSNNIKAGVKLSKLYVLFNELEDAQGEVEKVLKTHPQELDALAVKAAILFKKFEEVEANAIVDSILIDKPDHIDAASLKTAFLLGRKQFDEATKTLAPALIKNPDLVSLHLLKLRIDSQTNKFDEVIAGYKTISQLEPDNVGLKYALAKVYVKTDQLDNAEKLINSIIKENPDLVSAKMQMLDLLHSTNLTQALNKVDEYVKEGKDNYSLLNGLSNWLLRKEYVEKSTEVLQLIVDSEDMTKDEKTAAKLLLAKIDVFSNNYESAQQKLEEILSADVNNLQANLLNAEILVTVHQYDEAKNRLEKILLNDPKMDRALSLLGKVNVINGDYDKASINYKDALTINPKNTSALKFVVSKALQEKHNSYAIEMLERSLNFMPSRTSLIIQLIDLNITEKNWLAVKKYIKLISRHKNGELIAKFFNGKKLQAQKKFDEAINIYKELLEIHPNLKDALFQLAECYSEINQISQMERYLSDFISQNPYVTEAYLLKSQLLSVSNKIKEAIKVLTFAINEKTLNDSSLYIELGRLYNLVGNDELEYTTFVDGENQNPDNIKLKLFIASHLENNNKVDQAVRKYEDILAVYPNHKVARNNLATILVDKIGGADALIKAKNLVNSFKQSSDPYFLDTFGWVELQNDNYDVALSVFKDVILLAPNIPVFRYHLAVAYIKNENIMAAKSELKQALYIGKGIDFPEKKSVEELLAQIIK